MVRGVALVLGCALVACGGTRPPAAGPAPAARPKLVVLVVIDQLPTWAFDARRPFLTGGIARLVAEGHEGVLELPYAATQTAVGHAALATGAPPSVTGIIGNKWWDRASGALTSSVADPAAPLLSVTGPPGPFPVSPRHLRVEAVGDALKRATGGAGKVVTVSFKDRSAILMGGRRPDLAVFYDDAQAAFTTSRYYADRVPAWLAALATTSPVRPRLAPYVWSADDPALLARMTGGRPDQAPGEFDLYGIGLTFPHALGKARDPASDVEVTPLAEEITLEAALAAIAGEGLGADDVPDFLAISFSGHDYVGHMYGLESWEAADAFLRLDRAIGRLAETLDATCGRDGWALVLSSDHGGAHTPEVTQAGGGTAGRLNPMDLAVAAQAAAQGVLGPGTFTLPGYDLIYVTDAVNALPAARRDAVLDAIVAGLGKVPGVGFVGRKDRLAGGCDERTGLDALYCRSIDPERTGEVMYGPAPGWVVMMPPFDATAHGSANDPDRFVPVLVRGPGVAPGRDPAPVSSLRVAPTLAALLGVAPPAAATAPALVPATGGASR